MDAPLPEELELLEANYRIDEEYLDLEPPEPYPFDEEEERPTHSKSPPFTPVTLSPETQINGHKRFRQLDGPSPTIIDDAGPSDEKRCRIDNNGPSETDEDWLRYSPPVESNDNVEERVDGVAEEKLVCRFVSEIEGDFVPVTAPSGGDRVYAKMSREEMEERQTKLNVKTQSGGLLLKPINVLLLKMEQVALTKALQASSGDQDDMVLPETSVIQEQLWVDKYAPNSFTELLSDEHTNREVLLWLKQWDSCVFGSEVRTTSDEVLSALKRHSSISQHQRLSDSNFNWKNRGIRWNKERFRHSNDFNDNRSNLKNIQDLWNKKSRCAGPPEQKILLLCGPPGLGKTTLAHIAAKHCGYRVVEVNASDDRSSSTIEAKILDVVQMNSVTVDSRPKCLVIDEIDGALGDGKGAVEVILKMVHADRKSDAGKENSAKEEIQLKKSGKKGQKTAPLLRPVICICNDLYAPAVRPLRQIAKVHVFVQPTLSRVVSRLKYICNKEGMKTSSIALTALSEFTECDIRSCLNTLQFLDKKKEALNVLDIGSQVVGQKDMSRSLFDIWKEIFQNKKQKQQKRYCSSQTMPNDFDSLHSLISYRGDYDLIMDGIHENILQLHYHDPMMRKTVKSLNNLGVSELMQQYVMHSHRMQLLVYLPAMAISIHCLVAQDQKPTIEWPKSYQRYRTSLMEKMDILRSWYCTMPPQISRQLSTKSFVEESVSPLLHILSPSTLRPVAPNLMSGKEKNDLAQLVSTMVSYSITYRNVKCDSLSGCPRHGAVSDDSSLTFDPPINEFINFEGYKSDHYVLALAMKQVVVHEVEKQRILQAGGGKSVNLTDEYNKENIYGAVPGTVNPAGSYAEKVKKTNISNLWQSNPTTSTHLSNLDSNKCATTAGPGMKLKSLGGAKRSSNDSSSFFDRFRKPSSKSSHNEDSAVKEETPERDLRPVLFKFNEGFTNAVKRPVRIREFLLR